MEGEDQRRMVFCEVTQAEGQGRGQQGESASGEAWEVEDSGAASGSVNQVFISSFDGAVSAEG